jgi:leucyl-tRNA synthetase
VREGAHPAAISRRNIATFRRQIRRLGFSYDWQREISTAHPDYYRWTQWIFLKLYERGLAYMDDVPVNWCPALGTVLSNEEVKDGRYVETGDPVEQRLMRQWMLKITAYAQRLLDDLDDLDWPEGLKEMQRNWIGRSDGAEIAFPVVGHDDLKLTVFTTRPDTTFGATYMVMAPEHPLLAQITKDEQRVAVTAYKARASSKSELERAELSREKTGVFTGAYCQNPMTGEAIPIWVADYVLVSYGTGAIMAVPGQDERDWAFAEAFDLPIVRTVQPPAAFKGKAYLGDGVAINSGFLNGLNVEDAKASAIAWLEAHGHGSRQINYKLRDWLFSRQRYWGEPFPVVHLEDGTMMAVPEAQLPVELPTIDQFKPTADGRPPLARAGDEWLLVELPDGRMGMRETNTMPQWAGSCWYYLRFIDPGNVMRPWSPELEAYWMPVDLYVGGAEHAVLHLLYARFWHKVLYDCGLVSTKEPFQALFNQGMTTAQSFWDERGKYYYPEQVAQQPDGTWRVIASDEPVETRLEKMSKSKLNVVNPDDVIDQYGVDSTRLYELFAGPVSAGAPWQTAGLDGMYRFLAKVWRLVIAERSGKPHDHLTNAPASSEPRLRRLLHQTIHGVSESIETVDKLNTAISKLMIFVNEAQKAETLPRAIVEPFIKLLNPFAPHLAEELWLRMGHDTSIAYEAWPTHDPALMAEETRQIPVQVNGKMRVVLTLPAEANDEELRAAALADDRVRQFTAGKTIRRVIVVQQRLVNVVVSA